MNLYEITFLLFVIFVIVYLLFKDDNKIKESFNPYYDYTRTSMGTFAFKPGYGQYYPPYISPGTGNIRYNPGYRDYWYIPAHYYMDNWMNGISREVALSNMSLPNTEISGNCIVPPSISEYCVSERLNNNEDFDSAMEKCITPYSVSESC